MTSRSKPESCIGCPLHAHGTDFSQPEGLGTLKVCVVAEASGEHEQRDQLPLRPYAPSGSLFERTLRRIGLSRDQFVVTNCLMCRPKDNRLEGMGYEQEALSHCSPNLAAVLRRYKPKVLLALGNVAIRHLTGWSGPQRTVSHLRGYALRALPEWEEAAARDHNTDPLLVIPTFHPAFLRRGAIHLTGVFARDIARAVNVAQSRDTSYILDLPDLTYWTTHPDDAMMREKAEKAREDLAAWLKLHNLNYNLQPTRRELDLFCRDVKARSDAWMALAPAEKEKSDLALSWDLETAESQSLDEDATDGFTDTRIRLAQFTVERGQGMALPWEGEYIQAFRWLLKQPLPKCGQNVNLFDCRVVKAVGERDFGDRDHFTPNGPVYDTLDMFHRFQPDLPAHLQFAASFAGWKFPWKHLAEDCLPLYGLFDTDSALGVFHTVRKTLQARGMWIDVVTDRQAAGYVNQVQRFRPVLTRMEERGFPVDDATRKALDKEFEAAETDARRELDARFPDDARKLQPYKTVPDAVKKALEELAPTVMPAADAVGKNGKPLTKTARAKMERERLLARWAAVTTEELATIRARRYQESPTRNDEGEEEPGEFYFFDRLWLKPNEDGKKLIKAQAEDMGAQLQWCRVYEFSPNSSPQLIAYMSARRHKIPLSKDGKKTTGKKELERLSAKYKDDFYVKVIECREIGKMRGTYIDGFRPHSDGRVHTTFTYATATNQLSSRNPNVTNIPKHGRLAKPIRAMFRDSRGKLLVEWDKKSYHVMTTGWCARDRGYMRLAALDMHSFVTWHFLRLPKADELFSLPDQELVSRLKWLKSDEKRKHTRDFKVKRCIAEGELVLTDKGLVPIEEITLEHRLWDGVEWVRHEGLVYQGIKEVMTYDGLTATPDHQVVTEEGRAVSLGEAASTLARIETAGTGRTPVRTRHRDLLERSARERIYAASLPMSTLRKGSLDRQGEFGARIVKGMPVMLADQISSPARAGEKVRCDYFPLFVSTQSEVPPVRWAWDPVPLPEPERVRSICSEEFAARFVPWYRDRQEGQQWPLQTWELAAGHSSGTMRESQEHNHAAVSGEAYTRSPLSQPLQPLLDVASGQARPDRRTDTRKVHVYDIVNAGPRRCFTVSGKLVFNCVLGIGYAMGYRKLYEMYREDFESEGEAKKLRSLIEGLFPKVFRWQDQVRDEAHQQGYLMDDFGAIRWFYEVKAPDGKGGWKHGEQAEEAVAFKPASLAFGDMRELMKEVARLGLDEKWEQVNTVHDSLVYLVEPGRLEEHCREMYPVLSAPSKVLVDAELAPGGLVVDVEANAGPNWRDMQEIDLKKIFAPPVATMATTTAMVTI